MTDDFLSTMLYKGYKLLRVRYSQLILGYKIIVLNIPYSSNKKNLSFFFFFLKKGTVFMESASEIFHEHSLTMPYL